MMCFGSRCIANLRHAAAGVGRRGRRAEGPMLLILTGLVVFPLILHRGHVGLTKKGGVYRLLGSRPDAILPEICLLTAHHSVP